MFPDSKVHGDNMGPTRVLLAPGGPMLAPWTLLSGYWNSAVWVHSQWNQLDVKLPARLSLLTTVMCPGNMPTTHLEENNMESDHIKYTHTNTHYSHWNFTNTLVTPKVTWTMLHTFDHQLHIQHTASSYAECIAVSNSQPLFITVSVYRGLQE